MGHAAREKQEVQRCIEKDEDGRARVRFVGVEGGGCTSCRPAPGARARGRGRRDVAALLGGEA